MDHDGGPGHHGDNGEPGGPGGHGHHGGGGSGGHGGHGGPGEHVPAPGPELGGWTEWAVFDVVVLLLLTGAAAAYVVALWAAWTGAAGRSIGPSAGTPGWPAPASG